MNKVELTEACPRCKLTTHVRHKFILIDSGSGKPPALQSDMRTACACEGDLSVDGLKAEFQTLGPLAQFMPGLFCDHCGIGYIPEFLAKPVAPTFQPTPGGWRRVYPDGTLGPLLARMSDDPEVQQDLASDVGKQEAPMQLLEPWMSVVNADQLEAELASELGPNHPLTGQKMRAIAVRQDCDDVLFVSVGDTPFVAVVHLTCANRPEIDPRWPETTLYLSMDDWAERGMKPDHEDFTA